MFDKRVQDLLDAMTTEERLQFDHGIIARFNGTEQADAWLQRKRIEDELADMSESEQLDFYLKAFREELEREIENDGNNAQSVSTINNRQRRGIQGDGTGRKG